MAGRRSWWGEERERKRRGALIACFVSESSILNWNRRLSESFCLLGPPLCYRLCSPLLANQLFSPSPQSELPSYRIRCFLRFRFRCSRKFELIEFSILPFSQCQFFKLISIKSDNTRLNKNLILSVIYDKRYIFLFTIKRASCSPWFSILFNSKLNSWTRFKKVNDVRKEHAM